MPRGRPRIHPPGTDRSSARRLAVIASGGRSLSVVISADAARALDRLTADGTPLVRAIEAALTDAAGRRG
jgi:hypothetical protein